MKVCSECEDLFDPFSTAKALAGGLINHCPRCAKETRPRYLGLTSGDGKGVGITILEFDSNEERNTYKSAWMQNTGMHKGKSCQLSKTAPIMTGLRFKKKHEAGLGVNHKGKA